MKGNALRKHSLHEKTAASVKKAYKHDAEHDVAKKRNNFEDF